MLEVIRIPGAYQARAELSSRGYHWDRDLKCWYKNIEDTDKEEEWIRSLGCITEYQVGKRQVLLKHYFVITGNTFGMRDTLKQHGYFARKEDGEWVWRKEIRDFRDKEKLASLEEKEKARFAGFKGISVNVI